MENLFTLVQSLSRHEYDAVYTSVTLFTEKKEESNRLLNLLVYLRAQSAQPSENQCCRFVYGKGRCNAYYKLKSRLRSRILEVIISDASIDKIDDVEKIDIVTIKLRKKVAQFNYLYFTKGNIPLVYVLLEEVIKTAIEFGTYTILIEALRLKKTMISFRGSDVELKKITKQLELHQKYHEAANRAVSHYYKVIRKSDFSVKPDQSQINDLIIEAISELKKDYEITAAPIVGYYLKLIEMDYFLNSSNYSSAIDICEDLVTIINHKAVYRGERLSIAYTNRGHIKLLQQKFGEAINDFELAEKYTQASGINRTVINEQKFYALFYLKKISEAQKTNEFILSFMPKDQGNFRNSKYLFFKANVLFSEGNFSDALKICRLNLEITEDKAGWNVANRILEIMCNIELENIEQASMCIESLRKHLERVNKSGNITSREKLILKIFLQLENHGFMFNKLSSEVNSLNQLLAGTSVDIAWKPISSELIPVHEWLHTKVGKKKSEAILEKVRSQIK